MCVWGGGEERERDGKGNCRTVEKAGEVDVGGSVMESGGSMAVCLRRKRPSIFGIHARHATAALYSLRRWTGRRSADPPLPTERRLPRTSPLPPLTFLACLNN